MDREKFKAKQQWAGEAKPSMKRRRVGHDYQGRCIYMLTLVIDQRRNLLGHITGNGEDDPAMMHLSPLGEAVSDAVMGITSTTPPSRFSPTSSCLTISTSSSLCTSDCLSTSGR